MLVLMTIHDIMKLDIVRPSVLMAEFCGYKPGDVSQLQVFESDEIARRTCIMYTMYITKYHALASGKYQLQVVLK